MKLDDVKVVVGDNVYRTSGVNFEQTPHEYPRIEVDAYLGPFYCVGKYKTAVFIKDVIFNPPATVVFWSDNTKTVVKCDESFETYDPEKGLAMAFSKKLLGDNKFEYYNIFLHWLKKWNKQNPENQTPETKETIQEPEARIGTIDCRWDPGFSL